MKQNWIETLKQSMKEKTLKRFEDDYSVKVTNKDVTYAAIRNITYMLVFYGLFMIVIMGIIIVALIMYQAGVHAGVQASEILKQLIIK